MVLDREGWMRLKSMQENSTGSFEKGFVLGEMKAAKN
jgi:hypothetical protein